MQAFLIALQFLTRIPVRINTQWNDQNIAYSLLYYPLVGLLMGGFLILLAKLISGRVDEMLAAALILGAWVMLGGGLHLDGLADSADAWCGSHGNKQRALDIMKDPQSGPIAVVVLVLLLLIKFSALHVFLKRADFGLLLIPLVIGRCVPVVLFLTTPYVRDQGLGSAMANYLPRRYAWIVLFITAVITVLWLGLIKAVVVIVMSLFVLWWLRRLMLKYLDGMTGDTIGAAIEIVEAFVLCVVIIV